MPQQVPPVPGIPAGYGPYPADFTLWVTNSFSFLSQMPSFRGQLQGAATVNGWTLAHLDTILEDPYGGWSAVATGSQPAFSWLCPAGCGGWYEASLSGFTGFQGAATDQTGAALYLNGSVWQYAGDDWAVTGGGLSSGTSGAAQVPLQPGDYVQLFIFSTASVAAPAVTGLFPAMELTWISS